MKTTDYITIGLLALGFVIFNLRSFFVRNPNL